MKTLKLLAPFAFSLLIIASLALIIISYQPYSAKGSVAVTNEYQATSTASSNIYGATITDDQTITPTTSPKTGSLGSVVITGPATGIWSLYDATTTDVNKRTGNKATSTILLASFPASAPAGTYTLDVEYKQGLLLELTSGVMPTSTITYR